MAQEQTTGRTGSCACGAIQLRFVPGAKPQFANLCHCLTCQKCTGSSFACLGRFKSADVTFQDDQEMLRTYIDTSPESGRVLERSFCGRCGSNVRISMQPPPPDPATGQEHPMAAECRSFYAVPQGIIDPSPDPAGDADLTPTLELFCVRRPTWMGEVAGAAKFDKLPDRIP